MKTAEPKLNPNALAWVEALESGEYKQAKGALEKIDKKGNSRFCCLGVACDIYRKSGGRLSRILADGEEEPKYGPEEDTAELPTVVMKWLGLSHPRASFETGALYSDLAQENDYGKKFKIIAKIIRSKPEGLFRKGK